MHATRLRIGLGSAIVLLPVLVWSGVPVLATDPATPAPQAPTKAVPKAAPMLAQGTATITERNYFTSLNITAYSLTLGTMEIRADKQGPPCPNTETGQRLEVRYDNKLLFLGPEGQKPECKLSVRQMAFTSPPQSP